MQKLKTTANLAGVLAIIAAVLQWFLLQWEPLTAILLSLGVSQAIIDLIYTALILILTLLSAGAVYQVKARRVWAG